MKQWLLRAGVCSLAQMDVVASERAITKYKDLDASFSSTYECIFLEVSGGVHEIHESYII